MDNKKMISKEQWPAFQAELDKADEALQEECRELAWNNGLDSHQAVLMYCSRTSGTRAMVIEKFRMLG
jgi:hypothetical protein